MRRCALLSLIALCSGCAPDPACQALLQHGVGLDARLNIPLTASGVENQPLDPSRSLTKPVAARLLQEAQLLRAQLPASARDEELEVLVRKLNGSRAALEQAVQDFLAIDPARLAEGIDSSATMPVRRGVVISRDAVVSVAATACQLCGGRR